MYFIEHRAIELRALGWGCITALLDKDMLLVYESLLDTSIDVIFSVNEANCVVAQGLFFIYKVLTICEEGAIEDEQEILLSSNDNVNNLDK